MVANAVAHFEKARRVYMRFYGGVNTQCIAVMHSLGSLYYKQGEHRRSLEIFNELLLCEEKLLGANHPQLMDIKSIIAITMWTLGNLDDALSIFLDNLVVTRNRYGKKHIKVATCLCNVGLLYKELGKSEAALTAFFEAIDIIKAQSGTHSSELMIGCAFSGSNGAIVEQIQRIVESLQQNDTTTLHDGGNTISSFLESINLLCQNAFST